MALPILPALALLGLAVFRKRPSFHPLPVVPSQPNYREQFLEAVRGELGVSDPSVYYESSLGYTPTQPLSWCGLFALAMLHRVGLAKDIKWELGRGFLYRLPQTTTPQPGDLFYLDEKNHHGIVESIRPDGVVTLNGNSLNGKVARVVRDPSEIRAYYTIEPLIKGAQTK